MTAPMTVTEDVIYVVEEGIAKLTFNRPRARNALTFAMYEQMAAICESINGDRSIKALVLTGAGEKAFAVGHGYLAVPVLQDGARCARLRGADRSRAYYFGAMPGAGDRRDCWSLYRRRCWNCCLL